MTSEEAAQKLWPSSRQALWFLVWWGMLMMPERCAAGHKWKSFNTNKEGCHYFLHCATRVPNPDFDSGNEDEEIPRKKLCNKKSTWRRPGTVPFYAANNLTPKQYLACLYGLLLTRHTKLLESKQESVSKCGQDFLHAFAAFFGFQLLGQIRRNWVEKERSCA